MTYFSRKTKQDRRYWRATKKQKKRVRRSERSNKKKKEKAETAGPDWLVAGPSRTNQGRRSISSAAHLDLPPIPSNAINIDLEPDRELYQLGEPLLVGNTPPPPKKKKLGNKKTRYKPYLVLPSFWPPVVADVTRVIAVG